MKPRTRRFLAGGLAVAWLLAPLPRVGRAADPAAADSATPTPAKGEGKKKKNRDGSTASPAPAGTRGSGGSIPLPILPGKSAANLRLPDIDATGKLLSLLLSEKATRLDDDRVKLEGMHMDFNKPDGKQDFHVVMPASILNLKTHIITSDDPVTIRTQDFELTGEKMEFNTLEREGRLIGNVRMVVHNLKQVAGVSEPAQKTE